jgi:hypothetical protein
MFAYSLALYDITSSAVVWVGTFHDLANEELLLGCRKQIPNQSLMIRNISETSDSYMLIKELSCWQRNSKVDIISFPKPARKIKEVGAPRWGSTAAPTRRMAVLVANQAPSSRTQSITATNVFMYSNHFHSLGDFKDRKRNGTYICAYERDGKTGFAAEQDRVKIFCRL